MRVSVKLYGTLPNFYRGDYPPAGLEVDSWQGISVAELVQLVQLPRDQVAIVSINGRLARADDIVPESAEMKFFQPLNGG